MNKITFGKDKYHLHPEMEQWCHDNIGPGGWTYDTPKTFEGMKDSWTINSMFGNTTFSFRDPKHLSMFLLRWS